MKLLVTKIEYDRLKDNNETIKIVYISILLFPFPNFSIGIAIFICFIFKDSIFLFRNVKFPFAKVLKNTEPLSVLLRPLYLPIPYPFHVAISSSLVKITPYPSA